MVVWQDFLTSEPKVCGGEICEAGTRIPVTVILDNLAEGSTKEEILHSYPSLRAEHVDAALAYAAELARRAFGSYPSEVKFKLDENLPVELGADFGGLGDDTDTVLGEGLRGEEDLAIVEVAAHIELNFVDSGQGESPKCGAVSARQRGATSSFVLHTSAASRGAQNGPGTPFDSRRTYVNSDSLGLKSKSRP